MNTLKIIFLLVLLTTTQVFAGTEVPKVANPAELARGDYAEGTITRMTEAEIAEFRPWANNAKNLLSRALVQITEMPLSERAPFLKTTIQRVVTQSGTKQYQTLMRFALNRGMLLLDELERLVPASEIGQAENGLDILVGAVKTSLSFYESDLNFQDRAQSGQTVTSIPYAIFASNFSLNLTPSVLNVMNAKAQYRLLYKLVEMMTWDLSRDAEAPSYAEIITQAYDLLKGLPEDTRLDDRATLKLIRKLNALDIVRLKERVPTVIVIKSKETLARECSETILGRYSDPRDAGTIRSFCLADTTGLLASCTVKLMASYDWRDGLPAVKAASYCQKKSDASFTNCTTVLSPLEIGTRKIIGREAAADLCLINSTQNYVNCVATLSNPKAVGEDALYTCLDRNDPEFVACKLRTGGKCGLP